MKKISKSLMIFLAAAGMMLAMAGISQAAEECVEFNGQAAVDNDGDCVVDQMDDFVPEGTIIDNCPNALNGFCDIDPQYCNIDGSYNGVNPDTLSDKAKRAGNQMDWDKNGIGDACDDHDGDGVLDYQDNCKSISNPNQDSGYCEDTDNDGFDDEVDNCPELYNNLQPDSDEDGIGDVCDNCVLVYNPDQADDDNDKYGNVCPRDEFASPNPSENTGANTGGSQYQFGPDITQGNGGCSLVAGAGSGSSAIIVVFLGMAFAAIIGRRRT